MTPDAHSNPPSTLRRRFREVRGLSEALVRPLSAEDQGVQSMPDASPAKWHLAHTTWFFERMLLVPRRGYRPFDARYDVLFNSYYLGLGTPMTRAERGMLTRPSAEEVLDYRHHVDCAVADLLDDGTCAATIELGLNHEQQHQELLLTDIKHAFWKNPLHPAYSAIPPPEEPAASLLAWPEYEGGKVEIGHSGMGFAYDNERPRHSRTLYPFRLASRLVACGEYRAFIEDGGYDKPQFWLSDGWALAKQEGWRAPLYWLDAASHFTLHGDAPIDASEPVTHLSFYEASAYAAWAGKRLPTEFEWEAAAQNEAALDQMFGVAWQWTRSSYEPYPGFRPFDGAAAEYNGKFMVGQLVLRGGSVATPPGHIRATYRNFFPPSARWQFSGIRLAEDA